MAAHPATPFEAYSGSESYVFVSYAHADAGVVYAELKWLHECGINIWYDEGISPGHSWPEELARAIQNSSVFVLFVTPRSTKSENCERETTFALDAQKPILAIHLEETELPLGLKLSIGNRQAILSHRMSGLEYREKITATLAELQGQAAAEASGELFRKAKMARFSMLAVVVALLALGTHYGYQAYQDEALKDWARNTAIPAIVEHAKAERFDAAFDLAVEVDAVLPDDPILVDLWPRFSREVSGQSEPSGAKVYARPYVDADTDWRFVGTTPLSERIPLGATRWRLEKDGYAPRELAMPIAGLGPPGSPPISLTPAGDVAAGMVAIPKSAIIVPYAGFPQQEMIPIPPFQIGRHEVTNREFLEFVEAGGYQDTRLWEGLSFSNGGSSLTLNQARERFRDGTGRVGPGTWELGRYPDGQGDYPVSGISWYEAVAYARYRGGTLPTLYHWNLAAHGPATLTLSTPLAALMISLANIGGRPLQAVGASNSIGVLGTYDNAGNVREWIWNEGEAGKRWILGGSSSEADYAFTMPYELPPFDRSPQNGLRLMLHDTDPATSLLASVTIATRDYRQIEPVSDEGFEVLQEQFGYDREAVNFNVDHHLTTDQYRWETVRVEPVRGEPFDIHLVIPEHTEPPWQAVLYFPARRFFLSAEDDCAAQLRPLLDETVPIFSPAKSVLDMGRALAMPVWSGACERYDGFYEAPPRTQIQLRGHRIRAWQEELGRTLDYLDARDDISTGEYGYFGWSYGGSRPLPLLALEGRLKTAILLSGGFPHGDWPQIADAVNYVGRTTLPVLMLAGRFDAYRPVETAQRPLYDLLATPVEDKRLVIFEAGHFPLPRARSLQEMADWLDRYLGTPDT